MSKFLRIFGALAVAFIFAICACSDNATDTPLTEGDPNDPNYQSAQEMTNLYIDSLFDISGATFNFLNFDGSAPMNATADSLAIVFDQQSCWWSIYVSFDSTSGSMLMIDSLKFQDVDGCQQFPDSATTTEIENRAFFDLTVVADSGSMAISARENVLLQGIQGDTVVINATSDRYLDLAMGLFDITYDYDGVLSDLAFLTADLQSREAPKPISGSLNLNLIMYGTTQEGSMSVNWSITVTFYPEGYHARAEAGENYWEWDVTYIV